MGGKIFGLTGPSGVGKGFIKTHIRTLCPSLQELTVVTTRERRTEDGVDRDSGKPVALFLQGKTDGSIIFAHQPFGSEGDWYGFYSKQIQELLSHGAQILTEVHVDNIEPFKHLFPKETFLLGLIADKDYLSVNLQGRGTETPEQQLHRVQCAITEVERISQLASLGLIDQTLNVSRANRDILSELAFNSFREGGLVGPITYSHRSKEHE